jgi:arylsulfatase A-like enzyme
MLREPGRRTGARITTPTLLSDLFRTVLNATIGAERIGGLASNSRDLLALAAVPDEARTVVAETTGPLPSMVEQLAKQIDPKLRHRATSQIAVLDGRFKLMKSDDDTIELYDLAEDPGELDNLYPDAAEKTAELETFLAAWVEATLPHKTFKQGSKLSPEMMRVLQGLGYTGADDE